MPGFLKRALTPIGAGVLLGLPYALPISSLAMTPFGVVILLASLWSFKGPRQKWKGFGFGFLVGVIAFAIQLHWLSVVSWLGAIVLPIYLGLFFGVFGAFAASIGNPWRQPGRKSHLGITFANAAVWAFLEWLRGWLFTGFGWNVLGVAFHDTPWIAQAADLLGVCGISLLLVWAAGLLIMAEERWRLSGGWSGSKNWIGNTTGWQDGVAAYLIIILVLGYGWFRIRQENNRETIPLKALLVQVNIPQDAAQRLWDPTQIHMAYQEDTLAALEKAKAAGQFPDWVIWPESALTGRIMRTDDGGWGTWQENMETISNVREPGDFTLIYGVNELEAVEDTDGNLLPKPEGKAYNSMAVMSPQDHLQTFRKHHLVIFGETIPFVDTIPFLRKIYEQQAGVRYGGSFSQGTSFEPLPVLAGRATVGIIPSVCFEDTVPRLLRRFVQPGPQVIVNVTNDGWFNESIAAKQHFANARFRAIELRRPMIRCANTGVSVFLTSTGSSDDPKTGESRILKGPPHGDHFTRNTLLSTLEIPINPPTTLYAMIGDWGIIGLGALGLLFAFGNRRRPYTGDGTLAISR